MSFLEFLSSIIGSLAWPGVVITIIIMFRENIAHAIELLEKLKYKDLEMDFGRAVKQLEVKAKEIDIQIPKEREKIPPDTDSIKILDNAEQLAKTFQNPAIGMAWNAIELEIGLIIKRLNLDNDLRTHDSSVKKLELLSEKGVISDDTQHLLKRMRNLRNFATHFKGTSPDISTDEAIDYIKLARGIIIKLKSSKV